MPTQDEINNVIESTDMVDLVSPYVKLTKQGKNYMGLCPFHNEDTPSFVVSQEKHLAHCFGCGKGGNPINFLMEIKQISFIEALKELSEKNGIKLDLKVTNNNKQDYSKYYEIMDNSSNYYHQNLISTKTGKEALKYLYKRGLDDETIKMFQIGLAPNNLNSLYNVLKDLNYLELDMMDLGLINKNEKGYYDLFSKRIMFPICDEFGHVIGFSARAFEKNDSNQPKYINTKETFLYRKGQVLYNLHHAKTEVLRKKRVILHEGQMDVIAAVRAGLKETVCTMGTALTYDQALVLKKYATDAIICYDGDKAGIAASKKAINIFKQAQINVHLVLLPDGMDPDEYVTNYGAVEYVNYFESHILDELEYLFETAFLNKNFDDSGVIEQIKTDAFNTIVSMPSQTAKDKFLNLLAQRINASLDSIIIDYNSYCKTNVVSKPVEDYYDDHFFEDSFETPLIEDINKTIIKKEFELRLFMYARSSKDKALEIDSKINEYLDAFTPVNREIWMKLIDVYYVQNEDFNDKEFCLLLTDNEKETYLDNLESLRGNNTPYDDKDLELIIKKMEEVSIIEQNKVYSKQIIENNDLEKLLKKYQNKKKTTPTRRK